MSWTFTFRSEEAVVNQITTCYGQMTIKISLHSVNTKTYLVRNRPPGKYIVELALFISEFSDNIKLLCNLNNQSYNVHIW